MFVSANSLCHCGSRKKYKRCCRDRDLAVANIRQSIKSGEMQAFARVHSTDEGQARIEIEDASVTFHGSTVKFVDKRIVLETNTISGDKFASSGATVSLPIHGRLSGSIKTTGNATVSSSNEPLHISLKDNTKKMRISGHSGLFVIARVRVQRDTQKPYFDFLFGEKEKSEGIDDKGMKDRPHITLTPDGNGKFLRLGCYNCELEGDMSYSASENIIYPNCFRINPIDFSETLEVSFLYSNNNVSLNEMRFIYK